ncbi:replication restart DNA helicase PriA [Lachnospiraceae bacterium YSD2013]|nr:replication restart DNA helicase PriA [Lachnospiraceae bacterium YSD2013]
MAELSLAKVIINISHESVDRPFTYIIPESLKERVNLGSAVSVPFGAGNTLKKGYVVELTDHTDVAPEKLKEIADVPDKDISLSDKRIALAAWMKRNYGSTMIAALKTVIPVKEKVKESVKKTVVRKKTPEEIEAYITGNKRNAAQLRLLNALLDEERIPKSILDDKLHILASTYKKLEELGFIDIEEERIVRGAVSMNVAHDSHMKLSPAQQTIVDEVRDDFDKNIHKTYLIHGITGSGKTEVYMQIIDDVIGRGRQAIVLIPEISLTYQTLMRFYKRFGDRVCVMNSTLSKGEKYDIYRQAIEGEVDIVIGPRSALFTPFNNLGVIIIDEEHEGTYKSETMPKYHARETAIELARMNNASVILGSATPSIDSYYRAKIGEYKLFTLTERLTGNQLPNVIVSDLRKELREGNRSILSRDLQELIEDRLNKNEQIMLFLNRRGMAGFVSCRACGFVVKCPHCDVSLSLHRNGKLVCHYCGYTTDNYKNCPQCGSKYILGFKAGTEQVEEIVQKMYPKARTLRMDADTTKKKESYEEILSRFLDHEADILIGTQMIVKGHDFKNVTLMGVLAADMSLFAADYRAPEKTFDLLTQAAGRAGRGDKPGDVVIQTYQPDHYAISFSVDQDYEGFYEEEIGYRDLMDYPPAAHMLSVLVTGADEKACEALAANLAMGVREHFKTLVIGPAPASVSKINDVYRQVFYLKHKSYDALVEIKDFLEAALSTRKQFKESVFFDFDPQNGY